MAESIWTPEPLTPGERATISDIVGFGVCYMSQPSGAPLWTCTLQRLYGVSVSGSASAHSWPDATRQSSSRRLNCTSVGLVAGPALGNHDHGVILLDKLLPCVRG